MTDEQNPYQPPGVAIEGEPSPQSSRPPQVSLACRILWIDLAVGLASLHPLVRGNWWTDPEGNVPAAVGLGVGIALIAIFVAVFIAFLRFTARRHNWARWALLAFLAFGWYMNLGGIAEAALKTPFAAVIDVGTFVAELVVAYLLFLSPGAAWFRKQGDSNGH